MALGNERVLVVEDHPEVRESMVEHLRAARFEVESVETGEQALDIFPRFRPEVLVLDVNLPGMSGLDVCRELRRSSPLPILMVSALREDADKILGLELGADDYLAKPFNPRELVARVRAMARRLHLTSLTEEPEVNSTIKHGDLEIDVVAHRVTVAGKEINLTPIELGILRLLAANPGATYTRQHLLDRVWGDDFVGEERTTDSHVRNLRAKLRAANPHRHYIHSVWGVGYRFEA